MVIDSEKKMFLCSKSKNLISMKYFTHFFFILSTILSSNFVQAQVESGSLMLGGSSTANLSFGKRKDFGSFQERKTSILSINFMSKVGISIIDNLILGGAVQISYISN